MFTSTRRAGPGRNGRLRWLGLAMAGLLAAFPALTAAPAAAQPTSTPQERANAIVRPSVVYLETTWTGYLRDRRDGLRWTPEPVQFLGKCTGFVVSEAGFIVTAGHCVDPAETVIGFSQATAQWYVDNGYLDAGEAEAFVSDVAENSDVEEATSDMSAWHGAAVSGLDTGQAFPARIIDFSPVSQGDVAVIKVDQAELPVVQLADAEAPVGTEVVAIGYPASANRASDPTLEPSSKDGTISNLRTDRGVPVYEISAATTPGMSGGPVVDLNGQVIGLVSRSPLGEPQAFNFIAASSLITEMLAANGVTNQLSQADQRYREGLDAYFNGRYSDAIASFDATLARIPSHQQAQEYRQLAVERQAAEGDVGEEEDSGGIPAWVIVAAAGLGLLVVAGAVVLLLVLTARNRNRRAAATAPMTAPEGPAAQPAPVPPPEGPGMPPAATGAPATVAFPASGPARPTANSTPAGTSANGAESPVAVAQPETATYCGNCGAAVAAGGKFCTRCGAPVPG